MKSVSSNVFSGTVVIVWRTTTIPDKKKDVSQLDQIIALPIFTPPDGGWKMEELLQWVLRHHHLGIIIITNIVAIIITIIITRPKPPSGRQGLAGSWGKGTVRQVHYKMFSTSHFAPTALSSNWILLLNVVIKTHL